MLYFYNNNAVTSSPIALSGHNTVIYLFLIIIALLVFRNVIRGIRGRRYTMSRVLRAPIIYFILTSAIIYGFGYQDMYIYYTLLLIPLGVSVALGFGIRLTLFEKNGIIYYKRSQAIVFLWLFSYVGRLILELFYPTDSVAEIIVDMALFFTTGVIIGEAVQILKTAKNFKMHMQN